MNFVHGVFYIAIFSNMAQRQEHATELRHYKQVTTATLELKTKNVWNITDRREMETV